MTKNPKGDIAEEQLQEVREAKAKERTRARDDGQI
jgi:hypothetical protein